VAACTRQPPVISISAAPTLLPQLRRETRARQLSGRQLLRSAEPERIEFAAWAHDVCALSTKKIAGLLNPRLADRSLDAALNQARRDILRGRQRLRCDGVLPWTAYDDGCVEPEWWLSRRFADAIQRWRFEAVTKPSPPPRPETLSVERLRGLLGLPALTQIIADTARRLFDPGHAARLAELERNPWQWPLSYP
jgi:hypothetical protein